MRLIQTVCVQEEVPVSRATLPKVNNNHKGEYSIEHVRKALCGMIEGNSARKMEQFYRVPRSNLMRWFEQLTGARPNATQPLPKPKQEEFIEKAKHFRPLNRNSRQYFMPDEEEMFVICLEEAHNAAFPYNRDALKHMATCSGKKLFGKDFQVGDTWVRGFEKRWKERLSRVKSSSIDRMRGKKATAEVRDAVFAKFTEFLQRLIDQGDMTEAQVAKLNEHLCNADDEVGGMNGGRASNESIRGGSATQHGELRTWGEIIIRSTVL